MYKLAESYDLFCRHIIQQMMDAKLFTLLIFPVLMIIIVIIKSSVRDEKEDKQRIIDEFYNGKPNIIQERINKLYDKLENQNDKHE